MTMLVSSITPVSIPYAPALGSAVSVSTALASMATIRSGQLVIEDTGDNIARNLDALQAARAKIASISVSDGAALTIRADQLRSNAGALAKISSYTLAITDAMAVTVKSIAANTKVGSIAVHDTADNISANLDSLQATVAKISEIRQRGPVKALEITAAQFSAAANAIGKIKDTYSLNVRGVSVANLPDVADDNHVSGIGVVDTSELIASNLDLLQSYGVKLLSAASTDKAPLSVTAEQVQTDALTLDKIYKGYQLNVRGATLADLASLRKNNKIKSIEVEDTAENVARNLDALKRLGNSLTSIKITNPDNDLSMSVKQRTAFDSVLKKITTAGIHYSISGASVANAAELAADDMVSSIMITDTSANVSAGLATLDAVGEKLSSITLAGKASPLVLTAEQLTAYDSTIEKIDNAYRLSVNSVNAADAITLSERDDVSSIAISDSSANIAGAWDDLATVSVLAKIRQITQTGTATGLALTAAQIGSGGALLAKISGAVKLKASEVTAASAIALAKDSRIESLDVIDSSTNLSSYFEGLHTLGSKLSSIEVSDADNPLSITASQLRTKSATLDKISGDYSLSVGLVFASDAATIAALDHVSSVSVADTAANISANLSALTNLGDSLAKINVLGKGPVSVAANDLDTSTDTFAKIATAYSLFVKDAAAADANAIANLDRVIAVSVADSSANIIANLADLNSIGRELTTITQSEVADMEIDSVDLLANGKVLAKISNDYRLNVNNVSVNDANRMVKMRNVSQINIVDSNRMIVENFNRLVPLNPLIGSIAQSDTTAVLNLTRTQRLAGAALLEKINDGEYKLSIVDARATDIETLAADAHVATIHVIDSASNLTQNLAALKAAMAVGDNAPADKLAGIMLSGSGPLVMTASQLSDYDSVLDKIRANYTLDIRGASAEDASNLAARQDIATFTVTDSGSNIADNLDKLQSIGKKLKSIRLSGESSQLSLTAAQLMSSASALAKIGNRYTLSVTNVTAENARRVASNINVASMDIVDSSMNISRRIDSLQRVVTRINSITQSGTTTSLQITAAQRITAADTLAKLDEYTLALRRVAAEDAETLTTDDLVTSFSVTDSSENIRRNFDALTAAGNKLTSIAQSGTAAPISLSLAKYIEGRSTLEKIVNSYNVALTGVKVSEAADAAANDDVATIEISDKSLDISTSIDTLNNLGFKLKSVHLSDNSEALELSASKYQLSKQALALISSTYLLSIRDASAEDATAIAADPAVKKIDVADTSANVAANFDDLAGLGTELGSITLDSLDSSIAITIDQYNANTVLLGKISGDYLLDVTNVSAERATSLTADSHVSTIAVTDNGTNLVAHLSQLQALDAKLGSITLIRNLTPLALTSAQWTNAADTLDKIANGFRATVSGVTAENASSIGADARVSSVAVTDSGEAVAGKLSDLKALGNKLSSISLEGSSTIALTAAQLKSSSALLSKVETDYSLQVSEVAAVSAAAIGARNDVSSFAVSDSAANLSKHWDTLRSVATLISGINQSDSDAIALSASQFAQSSALLSKLDGSYQLAISNATAEAATDIAGNSHVTSLSVNDIAENLSSHLPALVELGVKLDAISVSDAGKISLSAALLQANADFMEKIGNSYTLAVTGAEAADATTVAANTHVVEIEVEDSSDNIVSALDALQALGDKLIAIRQSGTPSVMNVNANQLISNANTLDKITDSYSLAVRNAGAAHAMQLADLPTVMTIAVRDSAAHVAEQLEELRSLGDKLTAIELSDTTPLLEITEEQYAANGIVINKLSNADLKVVAAKASQLATLSLDTRVTSISVEDSAAHIEGSFDALVILGNTLASIDITGESGQISLTSAQYAAGTSTLAKIADSYTLSISGMSAADAVEVISDANVTEVTVSDTRANIVSQLSGLDDLGARLLSLQQSDTGDITVTSAEFDSGSALWENFTGQMRLAVTGLLAAKASYIAQQAYVNRVSISDTSAHIASNWDALSAAVNKLQSIELNDAGTTMNISASQLQTGAALIAKLPEGFTLSVSSVGTDDATSIAGSDYVSALSVADTADNIINALVTLSTLDKLASFTVTDSSMLELTTEQQTTYAALLAKLDSSITVSPPA